jgi:hypothetical protein
MQAGCQRWAEYSLMKNQDIERAALDPDGGGFRPQPLLANLQSASVCVFPAGAVVPTSVLNEQNVGHVLQLSNSVLTLGTQGDHILLQ